MKSAAFTIRSKEGLHARPAADFCETAMKFQSKISVRKDGDSEDYQAKSILSLLCMGAVQGSTVQITADGADDEQAIAALIQVLENT